MALPAWTAILNLGWSTSESLGPAVPHVRVPKDSNPGVPSNRTDRQSWIWIKYKIGIVQKLRWDHPNPSKSSHSVNSAQERAGSHGLGPQVSGTAAELRSVGSIVPACLSKPRLAGARHPVKTLVWWGSRVIMSGARLLGRFRVEASEVLYVYKIHRVPSNLVCEKLASANADLVEFSGKKAVEPIRIRPQSIGTSI